MKSGSSASFRAAGAFGPQEPDDEPAFALSTAKPPDDWVRVEVRVSQMTHYIQAVDVPRQQWEALKKASPEMSQAVLDWVGIHIDYDSPYAADEWEPDWELVAVKPNGGEVEPRDFIGGPGTLTGTADATPADDGIPSRQGFQSL